MRRLVACAVLAAGVFMPLVATAQDFAALFREINPSVVVVRAKGRELQ
jgi:hypothetical protein